MWLFVPGPEFRLPPGEQDKEPRCQFCSARCTDCVDQYQFQRAQYHAANRKNEPIGLLLLFGLMLQFWLFASKPFRKGK
jgi:hypothetical protein